MNENTSLWNKKASDLTVGDSIKVSVLAPIILMSSMAVAGGALSVVSNLARKIRKTDSGNTIEDK